MMTAGLCSACGALDNEPTAPEAGSAAARMIAQFGDGQIGLFGQPVPVRPAVLVSDANNQPVPGVAVTFALGSADGTVFAPAQVTNAFGLAQVGGWTMGNTFGTKTLIAAAAGLPSVTFSVTARAPIAGTIAFILVDPAGDTIPGPAGKPKGIDLVSVRGEYKRDSLILWLNFSEPVEPSSSSAPNSVTGFFELDLDDNSTTGSSAMSNESGASATLGVDYRFVLKSPDAGVIDLVNLATQTSVRLEVSYVENSVVIRAPMSALGNDDGSFSFVGAIGTLDRLTDVFPNSGQVSVRR